MAYNLGFGQAQEFGRGLWAASGDLPALQDLSNVRALANFSFGQGELTATPLQLCAMMNAISNGGTYASPKLVLGLVDEERQLTETPSSADREGRVMKASTAQALREALLSAAREGTGSPGAQRTARRASRQARPKPAFMSRGRSCSTFGTAALSAAAAAPAGAWQCSRSPPRRMGVWQPGCSNRWQRG